MKIQSKAEFFSLWRAGVLGNATMMWDSVEEAIAAGPIKFGFREIRAGAGAGAWELALTPQAARDTAARWTAAGRRFLVDGSVPNEHSTLQGEICRTLHGIQSYLAAGYGLEPMRKTMAAGLHRSYGPTETRALLESYMDPSSRDDLEMLLDLYPDATVEFACFDIDTGVIPGRNTIFWEVRNY